MYRLIWRDYWWMIAQSLIFYSASIAQRLITQPLELKPGQYEGIIWFSPLVFQVIFFPCWPSQPHYQDHEMITQLKNRRNNSSWKRWCLNTSFSHSKLRWIRDALVCLHARYCSKFHVSFCVFAPQGCKLSRAGPQTSYFYLFVWNTHTRPWNAFTGTSKCSRIWKRLLSPDVGTPSTDADVSPRVETYPPYCSTHPSVLKSYLK